MCSQFVVNGIQFDSDFEAALFIVLKSENLSVGKFYDEAVAEQKRLAKLPDWKLALLEDRSLHDGEELYASEALQKRVSERRGVISPSLSSSSVHSSAKRARRGQKAWVESRGRRECLYCHQRADTEVEAMYHDEPVVMYQCTTPDCVNPNENKIVGWDYPTPTELVPACTPAPVVAAAPAAPSPVTAPAMADDNKAEPASPNGSAKSATAQSPSTVSPTTASPAAGSTPAVTSELPSGKSIISAVQKVRGGVVNNKFCPDCKREGTEWVHDNAVLYICYNENCQQRSKPPLERIVGWKVKYE